MREDQGGVYSVSVDGNTSKFPKPKYMIQSTWGCNPENITKLSRTVLDEMRKIKKEGPTVIDLNKVKETLIRQRETKLKENGFWSSALQNHFLLDDKLLTLEEYKTFINSFSIKDIRAVANKYLNTENYVEVTLTPSAKPDSK
jgi:zinc protease